MIKIENVEVMGWEHAIRGMRNPKNSWERSDSNFGVLCDYIPCNLCPEQQHTEDYSCVDRLNMHGGTMIGPNDHKLMMQLAAGGAVHAKYRRMITVYLDITAPLYWWKEFDTYKVGTVANSCSTMHKIHDKEFTIDDFSHDHLFDDELESVWCNSAPLSEDDLIINSTQFMHITIEMLNAYRSRFLYTDEELKKDLPQEKVIELCELKKKYWWQMIQLLPSSYNQKRTVMLNYEVLTNMYESRLFHKLDEWNDFCKWIVNLPYSELITGEKDSKDEQ